ncbi:hypothetical protein M086_4266, partial [Bacteroides fragilis str. S13 L11]
TLSLQMQIWGEYGVTLDYYTKNYSRLFQKIIQKEATRFA